MVKKTRHQDFNPDISPMEQTLLDVQSTLYKYYEIKDWQGIQIILATAVAHYAPGQMLWLRVIGASRSGKTELLTAILKHPDCVPLEAVTPAAIRGGLKKGGKVLERLDGHLVVTKDFSAILTSRKDARNEIFGLMRHVKDGTLVSDFGNEEGKNGHLEQKSSFDWIMATTPVFEQYRQMESLLGERFIDLRWRPGNRDDMAYQAGQNNPQITHIRNEVSVDVYSLIERAKTTPIGTLPNAQIKIISGYGSKTGQLRTPVQRDHYHNLLVKPEPEIGTDITQGFCRIVQGLELLGIQDYEPYLNRLLWDCMPRVRSEVLNCIVKGVLDSIKISTITKLSHSDIDYQLQDLRLLEIIDNNNNLILKLSPTI